MCVSEYERTPQILWRTHSLTHTFTRHPHSLVLLLSPRHFTCTLALSPPLHSYSRSFPATSLTLLRSPAISITHAHTHTYTHIHTHVHVSLPPSLALSPPPHTNTQTNTSHLELNSRIVLQESSARNRIGNQFTTSADTETVSLRRVRASEFVRASE